MLLCSGSDVFMTVSTLSRGESSGVSFFLDIVVLPGYFSLSPMNSAVHYVNAPIVTASIFADAQKE